MLTHIGNVDSPGGLRIFENDSLDTIGGFGSLEYVYTSIYIVRNESLCEDIAEEIVRRAVVDVGDITVTDNDGLCP